MPCSVVVRYQSSREPCYFHLHPDLRKASILPQHYTASQLRRTWFECLCSCFPMCTACPAYLILVNRP